MRISGIWPWNKSQSFLSPLLIGCHSYLSYSGLISPEKRYHWGIRNLLYAQNSKHNQATLYIHLRCPKHSCYWTEVIQYISSLAQVPVPITPLVCLLEAISEEMYQKGMYTTITRLLYVARKHICQKLDGGSSTYREGMAIICCLPPSPQGITGVLTQKCSLKV